MTLFMRYFFSALLAWVLSAPASLADGNPPLDWNTIKTTQLSQVIERQWIPMRDGVRLDADIYLPKTGKAPYPTILVRTPYPTELFAKIYAKSPTYQDFINNGYAIVYQNERGRYWSEGQGSYLANAKEDGYDTVEWISQQPWSNGKVGTFGCSSAAENQLGLSTANHPAHKAAIAQAPGAGIGRVGPYSEQGNIYRGGALQLWAPGWFNEYIMYSGEGADHRPQFPADLSQAERVRLANTFKLWPSWGDSLGKPRPGFDYASYFEHLPIKDVNRAVEGSVTEWDQFAQRLPGDPAWNNTHFVNEGDRFHTPMLWLFSWYDLAIGPNVALYNQITQNQNATGQRGRDKQFMIIGPMAHCEFGKESAETLIGERAIGDARYDYDQHYLDWFDYWLKDNKNKVLTKPKVQYYDMGAQRWVNSPRLPSADSRPATFYLSSGGQANSVFGDGRLSLSAPERPQHDRFIYDPNYPIPTLGGGSCCMGDIAKVSGAYDQRAQEARADILVYNSDILDQDLAVAGPIEAEIYLSSSAKDTDLSLKLVDVYPDGRAYNLADTIFRVRYREGYDKAELMAPGQVYKIRFPPMVTANTFKKGHRIRLEISSSNFPRYDRNLNTGGNNFDEVESVVAINQIHHSPQHPSFIRLPVTGPATLSGFAPTKRSSTLTQTADVP